MQHSGAESSISCGHRARGGHVRAALLASSALIGAALPAAAQDATWRANPGSGDFNTAANWNPAVPTGTAFFGTSSITALSFSADTTFGGLTLNAGAPAYSFTNGKIVNIDGAGVVTNGGSVTINNNLILFFRNNSTAGNATINNSFDLRFLENSTAGNATIVTTGLTFGGTATAGNATITNNGALLFVGTSTGGNATITNNDRVQFAISGTGGAARFINGAAASIDLSFLQSAGITAGSIEGAGTIFLGSKNLAVGGNNLSTTFSGVLRDGGVLGGTGGSLTKTGTGMLTLSGVNTYTGGTVVQAGTLQLSGAGTLGATANATTVAGGTLDLGATTQAQDGGVTLTAGTITNGTLSSAGLFNMQAGTVSAAFAGTGGLTKSTTGTVTLSGTNTYSGVTTLNAGTLAIAEGGSIVSATTVNNGGTFIVTGTSAGVTVNAGGVLGGTGTLGSTTINGGTLAPGNSIGTITVQGNLVLTSAAAYIVEVSPTQADRTNVTGTATLAGTVQAVFSPGSYIARSYTILSAAGGRTGTFGSLTTNGLPAGFTASLSYTGTDAILDLTAVLGALPNSGLSGNQQNVASALSGFFNNGGMLPPSFVGIFGLTGVNLANALTLLSGEVATGAQQGAFQLNNQFLGMMLDPFVDGRAGVGGAGGQAIGFAPEREEMPDDVALAYAKVTKTPVYKAPVYAPSFDQRWSVWGGGYGGTNKTSGDPLVVGSHDLTARTAGFAAGLDYRVAPGTVVGFALAGGGTNWGLANGLGTGKSDAFQAGLYGSTRWGALYVAAALAYAWHDVSTDRFALAGNHLTASFDAQSVAGRVEAGYRVGSSIAAIIPYAAVQAQNFRTPSYVEADLNAGGFGLAYNSRNGTATRSELGARADQLFALNPSAVLALRGRLAWAHDWVSDPSLTPGFQALPGASFIVNGATPAKDLALVSAGAELRLANGVTLSGKFDGEFAEHSTTYAGTGTIRYRW